MLNLNCTMFLLVLTAVVFSETAIDSQVKVPRLYLKYRFESISYSSVTNGFSIISKPYFGYQPEYLDTRVKYFGRNIAKEMEPLPSAQKIMNGYTWHGIGTISCIVGGIGIVVGSCVHDSKKSKKKEDGIYDTSVPAGLPIGFSVVGFGFLLNSTKPIYLHQALKEYNKHAENRRGP